MADLPSSAPTPPHAVLANAGERAGDEASAKNVSCA